MITIKLENPIQIKTSWFSSITLEEVNLRAPTAKDMIGLDFSDPKISSLSLIKLASRVSNLPENVIGDIGVYDFSRITSVMGAHFQGKQS